LQSYKWVKLQRIARQPKVHIHKAFQLQNMDTNLNPMSRLAILVNPYAKKGKEMQHTSQTDKGNSPNQLQKDTISLTNNIGLADQPGTTQPWLEVPQKNAYTPSKAPTSPTNCKVNQFKHFTPLLEHNEVMETTLNETLSAKTPSDQASSKSNDSNSHSTNRRKFMFTRTSLL
jgi:hypothetical protein